MALKIERVLAWEALDSRGTPTVACAISLAGGAEGQAAVPSGASTGSHEAHELRDGGSRFGGKGVRSAVAAVNGEIAQALRGGDAGDQEATDDLLRHLDGTPTLERLGANAVLAVSTACALAAADAHGLPLWRYLAAEEGPPLLPLPMVNVLSGGAHAGGLIDVQDVLVVPVGAGSFAEAIEWAARIRAAAVDVFRERGNSGALVADEGGLAAALSSNREAITVVAAAIDRSGLVPGEQVAIAVDVAATQFQEGADYRFAVEDRSLRRDELVAELRSWCDEYPIVSVEDPVGEDDTDGWKLASERLAAGIANGIANAVLVKPNQVGTLSDTRRLIELARSAGYATVLSARSGDTEDSWLADLAVGWRTGQLKVGSTTRSERTAKWNRLLRLESEYAEARFAGREVLAPAQDFTAAMLRP